jgi:hypothetical protein
LNQLINKILRVGYITFYNLQGSLLDYEESRIQGSLLCFLFYDIYFSSFDNYVKTDLFFFYKKRFNNSGNVFTSSKKSNNFLQFLINKSVYTKQNFQQTSLFNKYSFFKYVRYFDNFLFGFIGPKKFGLDFLICCAS